jgi:predicted dehydrogenase
MLRIGLVGCGKIADQHALAIGRIQDCRIVAVCDQELLMAQQLAERFGNPECFSDVGVMLKSIALDVVHITTPPQAHFPLARQCLEARCHAYIEKPFTVTADEAEELISLAEASNLKLTAGHNLQFALETVEMRRLVKQGFLGGKPVHLESHFSYDLGDTNYVAPVLGSPTHWVRQLPGQLLHNIVSHGIAKLAEFLDDELDQIVAKAHQSPRLRNLGGREVLDELRVMIRDRSGTTAYFCFSTQFRPGLNQLRIFGPDNSLVVDHGTGSLIRNENRPCKSYLTYFVPPLRAAREQFRCAQVNLINFLLRRLHQDFGMKELIERFYTSIRAGGDLPLPYREILLTARIMDEIFGQIYPGNKIQNKTEVLSIV